MLQAHQNWIWSVACSPDGRTWVSASEDETIALWDARSGQLLTRLQARPPYDGMSIVGATGLTLAQRATLTALGAIDSEEFQSVLPEPHLNGATAGVQVYR